MGDDDGDPPTLVVRFLADHDTVGVIPMQLRVRRIVGSTIRQYGVIGF